MSEGLERESTFYFSLLLSLDILAYPIEAVLDSLAADGRARLDVPRAVAYRVQVEALGDLARARRIDQVLLVGEYEHRHAHQLLLGQQL